MSMFRFGMSVIDNYQGTKTTAVVSSYNKKTRHSFYEWRVFYLDAFKHVIVPNTSV